MTNDQALPDPEELRALLDLVGRLDADNERIRVRILEILEWVEEAVSNCVRQEQEVEIWHRQAQNLGIELDAMRATSSWRLTAPLRTMSRRRRGRRIERSEPPTVAGEELHACVPVFIPVRDWLTPLRSLLDWLERAGHDEIWLLDNASTYPPLLEFLDSTTHHVVRLDRNLGHRSPFLSGSVQRIAAGRFFVISDPDVVPDDTCPLDAVVHFRSLLERYPEVDKVGFGLRVDDLPSRYPLADDVRAWESRFWSDEIEPGVYRADIDTTFALYRPLARRHREDLALRTGAPYVARHTPWYVGPDDVTDEDRWYREHGEPTTLNWDRDELPRWKQRWLSVNRAGGGLGEQ